MSTTILPELAGEMKISPDELIKHLREWYAEAQGNEDKAGDVEDSCFYEGERSALYSVLKLVLGATKDLDLPAPDPEVYDLRSSASRQHWVETGRYLRHSERVS